MMLNQITDENAEKVVRYYRDWLKNDSHDKSERYEAHKALGFFAWREGDTNAMAENLGKAAEIAIQAYAKALPGEGKLLEFCMPLKLGLLFGNQVLQNTLAHIPRSNFFSPELEEFQPLAELVDILRLWKREKPTVNDLEKLAENASKGVANFYYEPRIQNTVKGLIGILKNNASDVTEAMDKLVDMHRDEALDGDYQLLEEGLMATWASVIYQFSLAEGMDIQYSSAYIPTDFLHKVSQQK